MVKAKKEIGRALMLPVSNQEPGTQHSIHVIDRSIDPYSGEPQSPEFFASAPLARRPRERERRGEAADVGWHTEFDCRGPESSQLEIVFAWFP
jgi:hypothetical protein